MNSRKIPQRRPLATLAANGCSPCLDSAAAQVERRPSWLASLKIYLQPTSLRMLP